MAKSSDKKDDHPSMDDMVEYGIARVIEAFGKGENLHGAVYSIVNASAHWGVDNNKRYQAERKKVARAEKRSAKRSTR